MRIIVGLGNPGARYARTRHNLGFWVIDCLSERWQLPLTKHKFQAKYGEGSACGKRVALVKPQTFMNRSGEAVARLIEFYRLDLERLLIIYDDLDLAPGFIRIKGTGSAGGHRGMESIIAHLNSCEFPRLRLGIGQAPEFLSGAGYVLQGIEGAELKILEEACLEGAAAVEMWLKEGLLPTMNHYNRRQTI